MVTQLFVHININPHSQLIVDIDIGPTSWLVTNVDILISLFSKRRGTIYICYVGFSRRQFLSLFNRIITSLIFELTGAGSSCLLIPSTSVYFNINNCEQAT